jgi:glycosyltransferase involved in cell wall biosynthesis
LQDPPELIGEMVARWREGFDVVLAQRSDRSSDTMMKRRTAQLFYSVIGRLSKVHIPPNVGDFRLIDARVVEALRDYRERERFMKGIFAHVGFRTTTLSFVRAPRSHGETKFKTGTMLRLAIDGIVSFSNAPLKIWTYVGGLAAFAAVIYMIYIVAVTLITGVEVPGYASLIAIMLMLNGLILMGLGIQGEYIARIFSEVKARPLYLVRERIGIDVTP